MQSSGGVEEPAVAALDERRDDRSAGGMGEALEGRFPGAVDERSVDPGVSDFAGGKDHECASVPEPQTGRSQAAAAPGHRECSVERIDEETRLVKLRNASQQAVGQYTHIGPHSPYEVEKQKSVQGTMRMIGSDDERAANRQCAQLRRVCLQTDVEES